MIDITPLKTMPVKGALRAVLDSMPDQISDDQFIANFGLLWNLSKKQVEANH